MLCYIRLAGIINILVHPQRALSGVIDQDRRCVWGGSFVQAGLIASFLLEGKAKGCWSRDGRREVQKRLRAL